MQICNQQPSIVWLYYISEEPKRLVDKPHWLELKLTNSTLLVRQHFPVIECIRQSAWAGGAIKLLVSKWDYRLLEHSTAAGTAPWGVNLMCTSLHRWPALGQLLHLSCRFWDCMECTLWSIVSSLQVMSASGTCYLLQHDDSILIHQWRTVILGKVKKFVSTLKNSSNRNRWFSTVHMPGQYHHHF